MAALTERCCDEIVEVHTTVHDHERRIANLEDAITDIQKAMTYRLPLWATMLIAFMSGIIGWLAAS